MTRGWWIAIIGGGVLAWAALLDVRHRTGDRLARLWVPRAKRHDRWAGPLAFLASCGALLGYLGATSLGAALRSVLGDDRWTLVVALPAMLLYGPFVFETMPSKVSGYRDWREALRRAGADKKLERAIAWWAGPPSVGGLIAMIATLFPIFGD